ncbi:MAG: RNA methyltransferase [Clostridia bacterium]|nr:RNA methyltransferase [Clostridia bacterium]
MPQLRPIRSRNDMFQLYETLRRNREKRTHMKLYFLEGVHPVEQAIAAGERFESIAYAEDKRLSGWAEDKRLSGWAEDMLRKANPAVLHPMPAALLAELSDRENPCELVCILHQRTDAESRIRQAVQASKSPLLVLCDRPTSPGNLGTIIRSADAFGACAVLLTGHAADHYDTQCIRASIGTVFHLPVLPLNSCETAVDLIRSLGDFQIAGTSAKGTMCFHEADFAKPTVLIVGNETFGMSKAWKEACDLLLRIPIYGAASSLNVGCAASICLYEIARQRDFDGHR